MKRIIVLLLVLFLITACSGIGARKPIEPLYNNICERHQYEDIVLSWDEPVFSQDGMEVAIDFHLINNRSESVTVVVAFIGQWTYQTDRGYEGFATTGTGDISLLLSPKSDYRGTF